MWWPSCIAVAEKPLVLKEDKLEQKDGAVVFTGWCLVSENLGDFLL